MTADAIEIVLAVIRGETDLSTLKSVGLEISFEEVGTERRVILKGSPAICVSPQPLDLAKGLVFHRRNPQKLRDWATSVLAASSLIDLQAMDQWPEGDEILSALWDASFAGELTDSELQIAEALVYGA